MQPMDFTDLAPVEVPVNNLFGKNYVIVEASGGAAKQYRSASLQGTEMDFNEDAGTRTVKRMQNLASVESLLVSLCLREVLPDGTKGNFVPQSQVEAWPARVQRKLYDTAKEISQLDEDETLEQLVKQRDKLNERIKRKEMADPKKLPSPGTPSSALATS